MKKKIITTTTQVSSKSKKFRSMLKTEHTYYLPEELITSFGTSDYPDSSQGWNVDILIANLKAHALSFLDFKNVPVNELDQGEFGIAPEVWLEQYNHIAGVSEGFYLLFEIHCFNLNRKTDSEVAYTHLLRATNCMRAITTASLEAHYFAGKGTQYGGKKAALWSDSEQRKSQLLIAFCEYRDKGKDRATARRLAGVEIGLKERQVANYWSAAKIEAEYQKIKTLKT